MTGRAGKRPRVLVVDRPLTRTGVRLALGGAAVVYGEADDIDAAVTTAEQARPDVCLVGMDVPGGGVEAVGRLRAALPGVAVVAIASEPDTEELLAAVRAGAAGYVPASIDGDALRRVVHAAGAGEATIPRDLVADLMEEIRTLASRRNDGLTPREVEVLGMLRRGSSTAQIAERLRISPVTVRRHVSALVRKLGASDRAALAHAPRPLS